MKSPHNADIVYYDFLPRSPVGSMVIGATNRGLCAISFGRIPRISAPKILQRMFPSSSVEYDPAAVAKHRREIEGYFRGTVTKFTAPVDIRAVRPAFRRAVLAACIKIPYGRTTTYGKLAARAGSPRAARAAGGAMAANPIPIVIPCHRVVTSQGTLGGYTGGVKYKKALLAIEGVRLE